jgi:hypothetical protein
MQRSRRLAACAATGLLTVGGITAGMSVAHANVAGFCDGSGAKATCTDTQKMTAPTSVTVGVTASPNQSASVNWTASCTLGSQTAATSGGMVSQTPVTDAIMLPFTSPDQCTVSATVTLPNSASGAHLSVAITYTTGSTASPSASASSSAPAPASGHVVQGFAGKCIDDAANSSANRAKVQIWTCNTFDKAQLWTYKNGELIHNGVCANDQRSGGNGSKVILYTCNGGSNELWTHLSNGEYVLKANGGKYCLDDPANSTRNGTQLIVYTCKNSANQRWSKP